MVEAELRVSATALVAALRERGLTLAAAESCTGGWFAKSVVDVPGASEVFLGGVVSYVNRIKEQVLGVPRALLDQYTAVSAPVAEAMAIGAQKLTGADIAVSVTGLAGPGGGTAEIPVGRVYIGLCDKGGSTVIPLDLSGTRDEVRAQAVLCMIKEITKRSI
ncbi:MAG: nicotinamide-nucleotide amidohydrolase family protein [Clostridia bacterium]|nr:nicotinamide-nucleotide amidohydrolase family protein [Clostridia bacterium]